MKRNSLFLIIALLITLFSCNSDEKVNSNGFIRIGVVTNTSVITKAEENVEIKNIRLVISNITENSSDKDWSKEYNFAPNESIEDIELAPGNYKLVAIASNGSETSNGFNPVYRGETTAEVIAGETKLAQIECKLTTVKISVEYDQNLKDTYQTEYKTVVGGVTFSSDEEGRAGYITPGDLSVDFMFKDNAGNWQTISLNKITKAKAQEYYKINISMKSTEGEGDGSSEGAANITIQVGKEKPKDIEIGIVLPKVVITTLEAENVEYTTATLKGSYLSPSGSAPSSEKQVFYYRRKSESLWTTIQVQGLKSTTFNYQASLEGLVASTTYEYKFMEKGETKEFTTKTPDITLEKNYKGVTTAIVYGELAEANRGMLSTPFFKYRKGDGTWSEAVSATPVVGESNQYKALLEGLQSNTTYEYKFMENTVESRQFKTLQSLEVLKIVTGADYATMTCNIPGVKEGDAILLDLKEYNGSSWDYLGKEYVVTGSDIVSGQFVKKLTGLKQNGTYCIGDEAKSFTTLYNANFDDWYTYKKETKSIVYPGTESDGYDCFWDSGNEGAATMSKNPTSGESDQVHTSGGKSAYLYSQFVGALGIGKFAAGNLYSGKYQETYMTGSMGARIRFGRPFISCPTQLRGWYKYIPQKINFIKGTHTTSGQMDQCSIYIGLTDLSTCIDSEGNSINDKTTAFEINTQENKYVTVNMENEHILAYGSLSEDRSNETYEWESFEIDLNYKVQKRMPSFIILVASASKDGDYFTGAGYYKYKTGGTIFKPVYTEEEGSKLYLDDFELVYDYTKPPYTN